MKKVTIYIDGASRGNPGPAGTGVVFCNEKNQCIKEYAKYLGTATNNEAEYSACILALEKFKSFFGKKIAKISEIEIRSDSQLLVKQMKGEYKIMDEKLQKLFLQAWNLRMDFKKVKFKSIPREKNKEADRLANEAIDSQISSKKLF